MRDQLLLYATRARSASLSCVVTLPVAYCTCCLRDTVREKAVGLLLVSGFTVRVVSVRAGW